jgi:hypothetical protein
MDMSDKKIKLSMFLEPDLAKAVKIQAARHGAGVSEIMRSVLSCAHCREPITDEFVIGEPMQVAQGKYNVFFHKNRPECRKASGERIPYVPICNICQEPAYQSYKRVELSTLLQSNSLKFFCIRCGESWPATLDDAVKLSLLLFQEGDEVCLTKAPGKKMRIRQLEVMSGIGQALCDYVKNTGDPLSGTPAISEPKREWFPLSELERID